MGAPHARGRVAQDLPRLRRGAYRRGGYRLWSLNLGTPGCPLYFLYAAAHGAEWEPGYGLMTFARHVSEGRLSGVVDL
ncbi:MAG TPA: hypothetical protein PL176_04775, partial [Kiritimatiellia bacterium]|nr:hypothetical protein [Kiritimatiellia bacterium]